LETAQPDADQHFVEDEISPEILGIIVILILIAERQSNINKFISKLVKRYLDRGRRKRIVYSTS
jgi:hypothetical protein